MSESNEQRRLHEEDTAQVAEEVVCTELPDDEAVLLHVGTRRILRLNSTGLFIWRRIALGESFGAIGQAMQQTYGIPRSRASADVTELVAELVAEELVAVERRPATNGGMGSER